MQHTLKNIFAKTTLSLALAGSLTTSAFAAEESFDVLMTLKTAIAITETNALSFVDSIVGTALTVVTAPDDALAATFTAAGNASTAVTGSVVEDNITMSTAGGGANKEIVVNNFTTGGDMDATGAATFDTAGDLSNLRIGGTANVLATNQAGDYAGVATFRLIY